MSTPKSGNNELTLVTLFSGCGGSSIGYKAAGYDVRLAVDNDGKAMSTYRANFPGTEVYEGDIAGLTSERALELARVMTRELDVLDGSPPCQGFSTAGKRIIADRRNRLFEEYVRLLGAFRPKAFVMENVSGLRKGKMVLMFAEMTAALRGAGYKVSCRELNAWWYGVPQDRRRLIWVGVRNDVPVAPSHPMPIVNGPVTVGEALGSDVRGATSAWGKTIRNAIYNNKWRCVNRPSPSLTAARQPVIRDWHLGGSRLITIEEAKILQGFPDWFRVADYYLIGNSVPAPMAEAIGRHVAGLLQGVGHALAQTG